MTRSSAASPEIQSAPVERILALFGGKPLFDVPLHVGRPNIGDRGQFLGLVEEMLDRRWFSNDGPLLREFECRIAEYVGVKHCVAMCNATIGLEIAIRALELGGEVIVPAFTFVATAHALQWQEITPRFADMDPRTHNVDPEAIERLVTPRTSAIVGVHVWGRACDTDAIEAIARRHGLKVIYDAAHAFGCSHRGRMIGNFGNCEVFSFHATKFLNSFEGGAVVTNDGELAAKLRLMRNFGFAGLDKVIYLGTNGKMTEVCAAMGLTSLRAIDRLIARNRTNWETYRAQLQDLPGFRLVEYDIAQRCNFQYVVVEVDPRLSPLNRDELVSVLHAENVLARKYFWPGVHRMQPYGLLQPDARESLPVTERVARTVMVLPNGESIDSRSISGVVSIIREALEHAPEVRVLHGRLP